MTFLEVATYLVYFQFYCFQLVALVLVVEIERQAFQVEHQVKEDALLGPVLSPNAVLRQLVQQPLQLLPLFQGQLGFCLAEPARFLFLQLLLPHHLHLAFDCVHRPLVQTVDRNILILK